VKIIAVVLLANAVGVIIYSLGKRRSEHVASTETVVAD